MVKSKGREREKEIDNDDEAVALKAGFAVLFVVASLIWFGDKVTAGLRFDFLTGHISNKLSPHVLSCGVRKRQRRLRKMRTDALMRIV